MFQDKAYTAALLHDVGRMGLLIAYSGQYGNLLEEANDTLGRGEPFDLLESERKLFGLDHCEAGRLLVLKWNLPAEFATIAGYHGDFPPDDKFDLLALVRIACALANSLGFCVVQSPGAPGFDEVLRRLPEHAQHRFIAEPEELKEMILTRVESFDIEGFGEKPGRAPKREAPPPEKPVQKARAYEPEQPESEPVAVYPAPAPLPEREPEPPLPETSAQALRRVTAEDILVFILGTVVFATIFSVAFSYLAAQ
jgi:hypothetical protein